MFDTFTLRKCKGNYYENPVPATVTLIATMNQWFTLLGKERWKFTKKDVHRTNSKGEFAPLKHYHRMPTFLQDSRKAMMNIYQEFYAFFCHTNTIPASAVSVFDERTYVSDTKRMASDSATLMFYILRFLNMIVIDQKDKTENSYYFRFPGGKSLYGGSLLNDINNVNNHYVSNTREDWIIKVSPTSPFIYYGRTNECPIKVPCELPENPEFFTSMVMAVGMQKKKYWIPKGPLKDEKQIEMYSNFTEKSFEAFTVQNKARMTDENSITGRWDTDCIVFEFLPPADLYRLLAVNSYTKAFVQTAFPAQLMWAEAATRLLHNFFWKDYGMKHLVLSSWGAPPKKQEADQSVSPQAKRPANRDVEVIIID